MAGFESNPGLLVLEATVLPSVIKPLPGLVLFYPKLSKQTPVVP